MWSWNELADQYLLEAEDDLAALNQSVRPQMVKEFTHRYKTELLTMWETEEYKKLPPLARVQAAIYEAVTAGFIKQLNCTIWREQQWK